MWTERASTVGHSVIAMGSVGVMGLGTYKWRWLKILQDRVRGDKCFV